MGDRALENRIRKIKELEEQKKALETEINDLKDEIRRDMTARNETEHNTGSFIIRFKEILSRSFDRKSFEKDHPRLCKKYMIESCSMRLTIS